MNILKNLSETAKYIIYSIIFLCTLSIIIVVLAINPPWAVIKGLLFGSIFSCLRIILMENTIKKSLDKGKNATNYTTLHYTLRYILTALVLTVSALEPSISIYGTALGLIFMRPSIHIASLFENRKNNNNAL